MRILLVARRHWPVLGGVESYLRSVAQGLAARHEVTVLAHRIDPGPSTRLTDSLQPPPPFEPFNDGPVRVEPLVISPCRRALLAPLVVQVTPGLRRYAYGSSRIAAADLYARVVGPVIAARARNADVVHMWGGDLVAAAAVRGAHLAARPVVITPFAHRNQWGDDPASAAAYRSADAIIALLEVEGSLYEELGVSPERITVCGVCSSNPPERPPSDMRQEHNISGPLVLFLGDRRPYKGVDILLEAASYLRAEHSEITFAFVGPGPALEVPAGASVLDVGPVDNDTRVAWLSAASLLCLPSRGEILPVSILEAWSMGKPVLTSNLPTLSELVQKAGGGETVALDSRSVAEAIVSLVGQQRLLAALGARGRAYWSSHYTEGVVVACHERLYEGVGFARM